MKYFIFVCKILPMLFVNLNETDSFFNLAAEEYLLKRKDFDCFMLWTSDPSVVIGKHQNARAEANFPFLKKHGIPLIRRISGGGAVYHDQGNINFSFIINGEKGSLVDFKRHTAPIIAFLDNLGIPARHEGKNDIRVNSLKVSGNSEHVFRSRVLHHGTLLYSADLSKLSEALKLPDAIFESKAIPSVRSKVANIRDFLSDPPEIFVFREKLLEFLGKHFKSTKNYNFTSEDIAGINTLVNDKYKTWEWNIGYSPEYIIKKSINTEKGTISCTVSVNNGLISGIATDQGQALDQFLAKTFLGVRHDEDSIMEKFTGYSSDVLPSGLFLSEIVNLLI